jgi:RNA-directed DNA polymerase
MEQVVARGNVRAALARVRENRGRPGVDGMTVEELPQYLMEHWEQVREQLLGGSYQPQPVLRREIPKRDGGVRELGIPCVLDRLIQQAILQVLQPRFDLSFSEHSYGFRPGRSAHDAVKAAQRYVQEGRHWVVDVDLEKFFDRVNHDVLMGRLARRISDSRLLRLIRRYLNAGMMADGVVMERLEGTPQGGPLSPLLANLLLDEVDKELEQRGHAFVRYADDCNVYVRSRRAGERVMAALERIYAKAPTASKSREEQGGTGAQAQPVELQLLVLERRRGHVPGRSQGGPGAQAARTADNQTQRRTEPEKCGRGTEEIPAGMEGILPTGGNARGLR